MSQAANPFRYFHSSLHIIRMVVMLYVRYSLSLGTSKISFSSAAVRRDRSSD